MGTVIGRVETLTGMRRELETARRQRDALRDTLERVLHDLLALMRAYEQSRAEVDRLRAPPPELESRWVDGDFD